ncbi:MAG: PDZ domain-containing protein, partial [Planctomycetota bacterium]
AHRILAKARTAFRRLPPPGGYIYHPTDMNYRNSTDPALLARRSRMIAEFRIELTRITQDHPETHAASTAQDLLFEHDVPEMDHDAAKGRLERAEKLLSGTTTPYGLYDAYLLLYEVCEGYLETDETATRAQKRCQELWKDRAQELTAARATYRALNEEVADLEEEVRRGGSTLPRERADELVDRLEDAAKRAGRKSDLARRVEAFVLALLETYAGPAYLGVSFDDGHDGPGVKLRWVGPGTSAEKAGLLPGDVIIEFDGKKVGGLEDLRQAIAAKKPCQSVEVVVRREGDDGPTRTTLTVVLGRRV